MEKINLAILTEINADELAAAKVSRSLDALRQTVYMQVQSFLHQNQGSGFDIFMPADVAWRQKTYETCGVVFGETEPALFMYFFMSAIDHQMQRACKAVLASLDSCSTKFLDGALAGTGLSGYAINPDAMASDPWINKHILGAFLPDGGLYSLCHRTSMLEEKQHEHIKRHIKNYALCVLDIYE